MAAAILSKAVGFLMIPVYTHYLTTADYGRLELLDLTGTLIAMLTGMGMSAAAMRYYYDSDDPQHGRVAISTAFLGGSLFAAGGAMILVFGSWPLSLTLLGDGSLYWYVVILAGSLLLDSSCSVAQSYMRILGRSGLLTTISLLRLVAGLSLNIVFVVVYQLGVAGVLLGGLGGALVASAVQAVWLLRRVGVRFDGVIFGKLWRYGLPLVPSAFATFVVAYADRFLLRNFGTLDDVGVYSLAYKFGFLVQFLLIGPFHTVWDPRIFDVVKRPDAKETFARILTYWFVGLTWGALGLSVGTYAMIPLISPEPYWVGRTYVWLIALGYVFNGLHVYCRLGLLVTDRTRAIGKTVGLLTPLWLGVYAVLIWRATALGAAVATMISYLGNWIAILVVAQRAYPLPIEWRRLATALAVCAAAYATAVYAVPGQSWTAWAAQAVIVLAYPGVLLATGFFQKAEREAFRHWLASIRGLLARRTTTPAPVVQAASAGSTGPHEGSA